MQFGKTYATKKEALNHYKTILNSYDFGETISNQNFSDLLDLLETHPEVTEKVGVGIESIREILEKRTSEMSRNRFLVEIRRTKC